MAGRRRPPLGWHQLPNVITLLRIAAIAPLVWLLHVRAYEAALALGFIAGASDGVDGYLARRFRWRSRIGGLLDPLADKLLLVSGFVMLTLQGHLPTWLLALVLGRDLLIVIGGVLFHVLIAPVEGQPTKLSKMNTFLQITLLLWVLVGLCGVGLPPGGGQLLVVLVTATTATSGIQYVWVWGRRARDHVRRGTGAGP